MKSWGTQWAEDKMNCEQSGSALFFISSLALNKKFLPCETWGGGQSAFVPYPQKHGGGGHVPLSPTQTRPMIGSVRPCFISVQTGESMNTEYFGQVIEHEYEYF